MKLSNLKEGKLYRLKAKGEEMGLGVLEQGSAQYGDPLGMIPPSRERVIRAMKSVGWLPTVDQLVVMFIGAAGAFDPRPQVLLEEQLFTVGSDINWELIEP